MKISSAQGVTRSRVSLLAMLALAATVGLAGCAGSAGSGPQPAPGGGGGGTGPTGPTGPGNPPISQGGDVAIGTGSGLTAQQITDIGALIATIDAASVCTATSCGNASNANHPVIDFTVKTKEGGAVLGLAASTLRLGVAKLVPPVDATGGPKLPSRWQSYINRSAAGTITSPPAAMVSAIQANTETGGATGSTWTELGAGKYRYVAALDLTTVTTPIVVTYEPTLTHRYSIALNLSPNAVQLDPDNPFFDFVPAGGPVTTEKLIAATANCATCHVRFAQHGGSRRTVEYCDVCHNPATTDPDSGESLELAYMAHSIHLGENRTPPFVVYGFNNDPFSAGDITYPQPVTFCEKCHTSSVVSPQGDDWQTNPNVAACGGCHVAGMNKTGYDATTGRFAYSYTHGPGSSMTGITMNDGTCRDCHRSDGTAGGVLEVHAQDPKRKRIEQGNLFTYKILKVENVGVDLAPKVTFQILQGGVPIDVKAITTGRLRLDFGWTTQDIHNVADIAGNQYAANRGAAITIDLIANMASVVDNGDGTYSYTLSQQLPSGFSDPILGTGLMVVLEGRRAMPDGSEAYPDSAYAFAGGMPRPQIVDPAKCNACHQKVTAHGGSRAGNPMICTICHSPSVGGTWPASGGGTEYLGPLALGAFIHDLHNSKIPPVGAITYPQSLARCAGCHLEGTFNTARPAALPITVDAGTTDASGLATLAWQDDLADSATAGTCSACHDSAAAQTHMKSQGGTFGEAKKQPLVPSSASEGCTFCHGPGRTYDTAVLHCNTLSPGECK